MDMMKLKEFQVISMLNLDTGVIILKLLQVKLGMLTRRCSNDTQRFQGGGTDNVFVL